MTEGYFSTCSIRLLRSPKIPAPLRGSYCHEVNCGMGAWDLLSRAWSGVIDSVCVAAQFLSGAESPHR